MKLLFIVLLAVFLVGCGQQVAEQQDIKADHTVTINNFKFSPQSITVKAGETVRWKNEDKASHTVMINEVESPELFQGDAWTRVFDEPGRYKYICGIHPSMTGTVVVE